MVVTGAAGGIGREVAKAFAAAGAKLMVVDLSEPACREVVDELDVAVTRGGRSTFRRWRRTKN